MVLYSLKELEQFMEERTAGRGELRQFLTGKLIRWDHAVRNDRMRSAIDAVAYFDELWVLSVFAWFATKSNRSSCLLHPGTVASFTIPR